MKRIYPQDFPKQTECRLDRKMFNGSIFFLLVDFRDETVIYVYDGFERNPTLTNLYKDVQFLIKSNMDINVWLPSVANVNIKRFDNLLYKY